MILDFKWGECEFFVFFDECFCFVDCVVGFDGVLMVIDMYCGIL